MDDGKQTYGKYLRALRKDAKLTLVELAGLTGLSHSYLSQIERGDRGIGGVPAPDILRKLSEHLGVSYPDLMVEAGYISFEEWTKAFIDADFSTNNEEVIGKVFDNRLTKRDLNQILDGTHETYYNHHLLKEEDRRRILDMLKTLFPEYQDERSESNEGDTEKK